MTNACCALKTRLTTCRDKRRAEIAGSMRNRSQERTHARARELIARSLKLINPADARQGSISRILLECRKDRNPHWKDALTMFMIVAMGET